MSNVLEAAQSEDRLQLLIKLRDRLSERVDKSNSDRDLAALSRQLVLVSAEIEEIRSAQPKEITSLEVLRGKLKAAK